MCGADFDRTYCCAYDKCLKKAIVDVFVSIPIGHVMLAFSHLSLASSGMEPLQICLVMSPKLSASIWSGVDS